MGNLIPLVQFARLLTTRDPRFSATVLIITVEERHIVKSYVKSQATSAVDDDRITFVYLPTVDPPSPDQKESTNLVSANELERALQRLMDGGDEARRKVKEMKEKARMSVMENGSSYNSLGSLIEELVGLLIIELFK
ncbi:hypothetical protein Pint_12001 [Pistacia integerrima]|uniref:Uncharacterized protein n=1 Tax=Pistacia integerrima TaxID=434235 RepID=A0ACC0XME7_9ROSI|nr:hypothetical protein Pint_12001 [Pistacia integerrima]